jgi:hypothetical protein
MKLYTGDDNIEKKSASDMRLVQLVIYTLVMLELLYSIIYLLNMRMEPSFCAQKIPITEGI